MHGPQCVNLKGAMHARMRVADVAIEFSMTTPHMRLIKYAAWQVRLHRVRLCC